jgi:3'-phosphoadenosine 5'-phosphosulfate sulfotransferase (PAPS reductase)/FAD synthetase
VSDFQYQNLDHYERYLSIKRLVVGVSGGRSSAFQMAHLVAAAKKFLGYIPAGWVFVFENTSLERGETYDFLARLDQYFLGGKMILLEHDVHAPYKFRQVTHATVKRDGEIMDEFLSTPLKRQDGTIGVRPLPNPTQRTCTANLKIKTSHRYVRKVLGWPTAYHAAIGYRADEKSRCDKAWLKDEVRGFDEGGEGVFPMFDAGAVVDDVDKFFLTGPFDLELDSDFGNCDFCFMASTWKIKQRMVLVALETQTRFGPGKANIPPARVARWIAWEERVSDRPGTFRKDRPTMRQLWDQVCQGNLDSAVPEGKEDRCGSCTD